MSRARRVLNKLWWLHSFGALAFGVGVMLFARKGLAYADKVLIALGLSWILIFVAFRFIVGAQNRRTDEKMLRKGVRLLTNYVIKQLYQQMFFFLVPLYAMSATWSLSSFNWWLVPILLLCAVLSTMDLVFDNFIMEHRILASSMYGLCVFGLVNILLPLVFGVEHFVSLLIAAALTAPMVAVLTFPLNIFKTTRGVGLTLLVTAGLVAGAYFGKWLIPPAPMTLVAGGVGHGRPGAYECVPGPKERLRSDRLDRLRCVSKVTEPGGIRSPLVHVWRHGSTEIVRVEDLTTMSGCDGTVLRSELPAAQLPADPTGRWSCSIETGQGQLVGQIEFTVHEPDADKSAQPSGDAGTGGKDAGSDSGSGSDAGSGSDSGSGSESESESDAGSASGSGSGSDAGSP